jgi:hypothetical protein
MIGRVVDGAFPLERMPTTFVAMLQAAGDVGTAQLAQAVSTALAVGIVMWVWWRSEDPGARALAFAASVPLATPFGYDYDLAVLAVPFVIIGWRTWRQGARPLEVVLLILLWIAPLLFWQLSERLDQQIGPLLFFALAGSAVILTRPGGTRRATPASPVG